MRYETLEKRMYLKGEYVLFQECEHCNEIC
mgnify:CR=1 FL=1